MNWIMIAIGVVVLYFVWKIIKVVRSMVFRVIGLAAAALSLWRLYTLFQL